MDPGGQCESYTIVYPGSVSQPAAKPVSGPLLFGVLIVGFIIVTLALRPSLQNTLAVTRDAECQVNLELIADRQQQLHDAQGTYRTCSVWPPQHPNAEPVLWADAPACWAELGFEPDVRLWGRYEVSASRVSWTATCEVDSDGDGAIARWSATDATTASKAAGTAD